MRLLFITPSFFGYEKVIVDAFRSRGIDVDLADERPSNSAVGRAVLRLAPKLVQSSLKRHYDDLLARFGDVEYDGLLAIKGENLPEWFLREFRARNPGAVTMFYSFDAISNSSHCVSLFPLFDRLYSFDRGDVARYPVLEYKPLFYSADFAHADPARPSRYLASFVGTLHSDRYEFVRAITRDLDIQRTLSYFYSQAKWYFLVQRLTDRRNRRVSASEVSFDKMDRAQVAEIFASSRAVIDFQRPGQSGLTMRTFEALASGAALITTNASVTDEPFYSADRVLVVDRDPAAIDSAAVAAWIEALPPSAAPPAGFDAYGVSQWVEPFVSALNDRAAR
jgi:hypothetical protein